MQIAWPVLIGKYRTGCLQTFSLGERTLPDTSDVGFSKSMVQAMKIRCGVFNKIFLVNHWCDILDCSIV